MTAEQKPNPHVLIAGAGLGGLALAQALRKQGISFEIFERSTVTRAQGYAIGIHSIIKDLVAAFPSDLGSPSVADHLLPLDLPAQIIFYDGQNLEPRIGVQSSGRDDVIRANRQRFRDWLATDIDIQYGKLVEEVEEDVNSVTLRFQDGTNATGDFLVGADGAFSKVRRSIFTKLGQSDPLQPLPLAMIVAEVTLEGADFERQLELANSCYISGYHTEGGIFVGLNSVSPDGKSARYYWTVSYYDEHANERRTATADKEDLYKLARSKIEKMNPRFLEIVDKTKPSDIVQPGLTLQDVEIEALPVSRVTLLGDAAHCMTPFRGEGGIHAMRDSLILARLIAKIKTDGTGFDGWKAGVTEYQKEMLERGVKAVRMSRMTGNRPTAPGETARMAWSHPAGPLPSASVSLASIPHVKGDLK